MWRLCFISGLTSGVRYNISLFAVTTRGVSAPSSRLVYSHELSKFGITLITSNSLFPWCCHPKVYITVQTIWCRQQILNTWSDVLLVSYLYLWRLQKIDFHFNLEKQYWSIVFKVHVTNIVFIGTEHSFLPLSVTKHVRTAGRSKCVNISSCCRTDPDPVGWAACWPAERLHHKLHHLCAVTGL